MKILFMTPHVTADGSQHVRASLYSLTSQITSGLMYIPTEVWDPRRCGRKNFALVQALNSVHRQGWVFDAVCVIDDDVIAHHGDIATRLREDFERGFDVVSGQRRFTSASTMQSAIRLAWQHYATPAMRFSSIAWGGCLAFRSKLLPDFRSWWSQSLFDDTFAANLGKKFYSDPHLVLDDDSTWRSWSQLWNFIIRQLVDVRLYGNWLAVWIVWLMCVGVLVAHWFLPPAVTITAYVSVSIGIARGWRVALGIFGALVVHIIGVPCAQLARYIRWQGIRYNLEDYL